MKSRILILVAALFLLNSCIVKSLQPFYTKAVVSYNETLKGSWKDQKNRTWEIISFKEEWEKETDPNTKLSKEDKDTYERYKDGYYIGFRTKKTEAGFIGMPFKVNEHLFIDFTPFEYGSNELNGLAAGHLLKTHSVAYVEIGEDASITLKWLSEKAINHLIRENKLRIKHEKTGIDDDLVLTATSEELHNFLKKFIALDFDSKWDNDDIYTLKPSNARP